MATQKSYPVPARDDQDNDYGSDFDRPRPAQRATSIRAYVVQMVSISMSTTEIDTLAHIVTMAAENLALSPSERLVAHEFRTELASVR